MSRRSPKVPPAPLSAAAPPAPASTRWLGPLLFFATLLAYFPALSAGFIWDDAGHVTRADLRSFDGLIRIWFEPGATQQYYPLLHSVFWLEHLLWGDAPLGYHLANIFLHATAACLFATLLRRLAVPGAWLAAFLFALHPVAVESVAWITEQKNTLSLVCYLGAALAYLRFDRERLGNSHPVGGVPSPRIGTAQRTLAHLYFQATLLFVAALLSKSVTATLPAALLVIFWWQRGRLDWRRDVQPLLPWFALAALAGAVTAWMEHAFIGAQGSDFSLSFLQRLLLSGRALWFYFTKLLWPAELIFIYPRWTLSADAVWQYLFPVSAIAVLGVLWTWRHRSRAPLAAALLFAGTLFPALGFINVYPFIFSFVADHFRYHASLALFAVAAAGATILVGSFPRPARIFAAVIPLLSLAALTWAQATTYRDLFTLYEATLARNPASWMAHNNLASALVEAGRAADALPHFEQALKLRPNYPEAENNLGDALTRLGRAADAIPHLERALVLKPAYASAHNNLGAAFMALNRTPDGINEFTEAVRLDPKSAVSRFNLGLALASSGRTAEAIPHFSAAVRLQPAYPDAELNWAIALTLTDHFPEAAPHFETALRLAPGNPTTHHSFARALALAGRYDEAISHFEQALQLAPDFADAHFQLALALRQTGRNGEARQHLQEARRLRPGAY